MAVMPSKPKKLQVIGKVNVECDDELSLDSDKPVQNKVIKAALDKKLGSLNIARNTDIDKLFR
jgi:hypothetical protein